MDTERHLAALRHESAALAEAARRGLDARVPSCPDWDVAALVRHNARAFRWATEIVRRHADAEVSMEDLPDPPGDDVVAAFEEATAELVDVLANEAPDTRVWTWSEGDFSVRFWARRMANEVAVHRWDAQLAHGEPEPIEPELAADGVDELLTVFLSAGLGRRPVDGLAGTFEVLATDTGDAWHGELWPDRAEAGAGRAVDPPDATLRGTVSDLLLAMWGRDVPVERGGDPRIIGVLTA
ncbi:MAG: hypothetical protein QOE45_2892 [Frankiaceae bacterium]|jgi:uncharacterized protein (TIGR03083 family)|nr:hypothetical protein [Frankiaceae bacterium]